MVLGGRSRRGERRLDAFGIGHLKSAVDFVRGDVVETLALVLLRQRLPIELGSLQERERTHHVGACKGERILDGAVHVTLGGQMDDAVDLLVLHQLVEGVEVADVHPHELVIRLVLDVLQIGQIAGVGELVEIDDIILGIFVHKEANNMASDESGTAGDNDILHI